MSSSGGSRSTVDKRIKKWPTTLMLFTRELQAGVEAKENTIRYYNLRGYFLLLIGHVDEHRLDSQILLYSLSTTFPAISALFHTTERAFAGTEET